MKDPAYQNESLIILDASEALIFQCHDDNGNPTGYKPITAIPLKAGGKVKYRLSDLRRE